MKVPIKLEDKNKSYYKYYELDIKTPLPDFVAAIQKGTKAEALSIHDRAKLLTELLPAKTAYYPLKEGGLLFASNIEMKGITPDMLWWWWPWHSLDAFRYTIWDPDDHFDVQLNEEGRARALDPKVPMQE
ncbi:MAG: hypothetical protein LBJ21_09870, partial [Acidobacteriota bacterium]|nr:hypothetical protein [Acidobacteriota bacterium]